MQPSVNEIKNSFTQATSNSHGQPRPEILLTSHGIAPVANWLDILNMKCWGTWTHTFHTTIFIICFSQYRSVGQIRMRGGQCNVIELYRGNISISIEKHSETICIPLSIALIDMVVYIHKIPVHMNPTNIAGQNNQ